jgi:GIY-YIG catalytic domain
MSQFVYALVHPLTEEVGYVGITDNLYQRFKAHLGDRTQGSPKVDWIKGLKQAGLIPALKVLECLDTLKEARERERYWIRYYLAQGIRLTNIVWAIPQHKVPQVANNQSIEDKPIDANDLMSVADIMGKYGVSRMTIHRRIKEGALKPVGTVPALYRQHKLLFNRKDVEQLLNKKNRVITAA